MSSNTNICPPPDTLSNKANILVDEDCNARLADFGLLTIVSDPTIFTTSSSIIACGTTRWMSPELLHPSQFGLKDHRPTKESDFYALGMVIYEVLSGKVPFATSVDVIVMRKVVEGEHPERPEGVQGLWFTDDLWEMLNRCWATQPKRRPSIVAISECLERASTTWEPPPHQADENPERDEEDWDLTEIVFALWSVISIPFTPDFRGEFHTDYAPGPPLDLTLSGTQPPRSQFKPGSACGDFGVWRNEEWQQFYATVAPVVRVGWTLFYTSTRKTTDTPGSWFAWGTATSWTRLVWEIYIPDAFFITYPVTFPL